MTSPVLAGTLTPHASDANLSLFAQKAPCHPQWVKKTDENNNTTVLLDTNGDNFVDGVYYLNDPVLKNIFFTVNKSDPLYKLYQEIFDREQKHCN